jgi:hypothetical protein
MKIFLVVVESTVKRQFGGCRFHSNEEVEVAVRVYLAG